MLPRERYLHENARMLRLNMTPEEKHLWYDFLKKLPVPVKRQYCIKGYIVDFYIPGKKTVIEVDGLQHARRRISERMNYATMTSEAWGSRC